MKGKPTTGEPIVSWREVNDVVTFRLENVDRACRDALKAAFWSRHEFGWEKVFSRDGLGMEAVKQNLPRLAGPMLRQMREPVQPWEDALEAFAERAEAAGLRWWLVGSGATALRVPGIEPHDLDVMLDESQVELAAEVFADELVEPLCWVERWVTRAFGVIFLGVRIDLAAGPEKFVDHYSKSDFGPWVLANPETIEWRGHAIWVPPLKIQAEVNRRRGRLKRARQIEAVLAAAGEPLTSS